MVCEDDKVNFLSPWVDVDNVGLNWDKQLIRFILKLELEECPKKTKSQTLQILRSH